MAALTDLSVRRFVETLDHVHPKPLFPDDNRLCAKQKKSIYIIGDFFFVKTLRNCPDKNGNATTEIYLSVSYSFQLQNI